MKIKADEWQALNAVDKICRLSEVAYANQLWNKKLVTERKK